MIKCEACTYHRQSCSGFIHCNFKVGVGDPASKVMLIYDSPFLSDLNVNRLATDSQYNTQLNVYLNRIGLSVDNIYVTTFIKCFISNKKKKPTKLMKEKCVQENLKAELELIKPEVVILCGSMSTKYFLPDSKTVTQVVGQAFFNAEYNCHMVPIFDPFYLANFTNQSVQVRRMDQAFARIKVLLNGGQTQLPQEITERKLVYYSDINKLKDLKDIVSVDVETTGLDTLEDRIITVGIGDNETRVVFDVSDSSGYPQMLPLIEEMKAARKENEEVEKDNARIKQARKNKTSVEKVSELPHPEDFFTERLNKLKDIIGKTFSKEFLPSVAEALKTRKAIYQNGLFDLKMFLREGHDVTESITGDTRLLQYLKDPMGANGLGFLIQLYYGVTYKETVDRGNLIEMNPADRKYYNNEDLYYTYRLFCDLYPQIKKSGGEMAHAIKVNVSKILTHTEHRGILIDTEKCDQLIDFYTQQKKQAEKHFKERFELSDKFNLNSPPQLSKLLYQDLGLPVLGKTAEGNPSTDADTIQMLYNRKPSLQKLIDYRTFKGHIEKLSLYRRSIAQDGRLHTEFNMYAQDSARLMSKKPNIQNVPRNPLAGLSDKDIKAFTGRYGYSPDLKAIFVAAPGYKFCYYDFSQVEFRVWIELAKDPRGIEFIQSGRDIHAYIASQFYREPEETFLDKKNEEARERRNGVKTIVYGSMYGRTPEGIVKEHGGSVQDAEQIQRIFFNICRVGYMWMQQVEQKVLKEHELFTPFGAHRIFPDVELATGNKKDSLLREAKSFIVQSWAAELGFIAMWKVWSKIREAGLDAYYIHQIHDAAILEVREEHLEKVQEIVSNYAKNPYSKMKLPLDIEMKVGGSWSEVA